MTHRELGRRTEEAAPWLGRRGWEGRRALLGMMDCSRKREQKGRNPWDVQSRICLAALGVLGVGCWQCRARAGVAGGSDHPENLCVPD